MRKKMSIGGIIIIIFTIGLLLFIGVKRTYFEKPKDAYMVYLGGKKIGLLEDKDSLYNLIDQQQENIKANFNVEKVYPPEDLKTIAYTTYNKKLKSAEDIYNIIEDKSTFTIKGYTVTIKPPEKDPIEINILNKEDLEPALMDAVSAFISIDELNAYIKNNQIEIVDTGKTIQNVYFEERITIKETFLNVEEDIITNQSDLTKYLLFGTLEPQKEYTVKEGDTVETVAYNNQLSNEELLIANPNLSSVNTLLSPGQTLNIGLIAPLFTIVEESEVIRDVDANYNTITETDNTLYASESYTKQEGSNGINRVTALFQYKNGETMNLAVTKMTPIKAAVDKIYVKGTKPSVNYNNYPPAASTTDWGWPTISPYIITSYYGWRWGRLHGALDISGSGFGSPIFSSTNGTVIATNSTCPDRGYYGSSCGGQMGNYVEIQSDSGLIIYYGHMRKDIKVYVGQTVTKGQQIGTMGNSGSSTGTHLHFEIRDASGNKYNPCRTAFAC